MGNYLKMIDKQRISALLDLGWSYRKIQRETGVRRETISRYDPRHASKAAKVSTGEMQNRPGCPPAVQWNPTAKKWKRPYPKDSAPSVSGKTFGPITASVITTPQSNVLYTV